MYPRAAECPGAHAVGAEHHLVLGREQRLGAQDLPCLAGVLGRHEVGSRACRAFGGHPEHPASLFPPGCPKLSPAPSTRSKPQP